MSPSAASRTEPRGARADEPHAPAAARGWFGLSSTAEARPPLEFWTLQAYLFLQLSLLDEILPSLERLRPRFALGVFTLLAALVRTLLAPRPRFGPRPRLIGAGVSRCLAAFVIASALSTLWAFDAGLARPAFQQHLTSLVGFLLIVALVRSRGELLLTTLTLCAGGGVYLAWSFYEFSCGRMDFAQGVPRMIGAGITNADANSLGATVVFLVPLAVWVGTSARSWLLRFAALAYGGLAAACVFLTSSRSALMLLAANVPFALLLLPRGLARWTALGLLAGVVAWMAAGLSPEQTKRIASIFSADTYEHEESTLGRIEGYRVAFRIVTEKPVLGVGPGNWGAYRRQRIDGDTLEPHNLLGQLIATRGLLGGVTFVAYLAAAFALALGALRGRWRSADRWERAVARLALTCVVTLGLLLVSGLAAHNLERPNWVWMPALLVAALRCRGQSVLDLPGLRAARVQA